MKIIIMCITVGLCSKSLTKADKRCFYDEGQSSSYYIYNGIVNTTVYYCYPRYVTNRPGRIINLTSESVDRGIVNRCVFHVNKTFSLTTPPLIKRYEDGKKYISLYEETAKIDINQDTIILSSSMNCTYSDGECFDFEVKIQDITVYWKKNEGLCSVMEKIGFRDLKILHVAKNSSEQYAVGQYNSSYFSLKLLGEENFCKLHLWGTNQRGIFISRGDNTKATILGGADASKYLTSWQNNNDLLISTCGWMFRDAAIDVEVTQLQDELNYFTIFLLVCVTLVVLISVFGVRVNCISIKKAAQERPTGSKMNFLRCFFQSLTLQYLYFKDAPHDLPLNQQLYESVDNELYNKH